MDNEQKIELLMSICAYTGGEWTPEDCYEFYCYIYDELEEQKTKPDIRVIKSGSTDPH